MKVLAVVGTRPEAIKMAPVIQRLRSKPDLFDSRVCVTGQHRQMLDQVFDLFALRAHHDLDIMTPGQSLTEITRAVLGGLAEVIEFEQPDWILVQGDTTTAMAASLAAFYHNVPVGHVEAGLRTHDIYSPFPEEVNRRITGVIAASHFAPTEWAADNLRREGVPENQIFVTGNTVIDAFRHVTGVALDINATPLADIPLDRRLVVATVHRRENFGARLTDICQAIRTLAALYRDIHIVLPVHPNPHVHEPVHRLLGGISNISLLPPLDYHPLVWLLSRAQLLITDSGGIQEEATAVGTPVLVLRDTTERPEGIDAGSARLVGADRREIVHWSHRLLTDAGVYAAMANATNPYGDGRAAHKIVDVLAAAATGRSLGRAGLDSESYEHSDASMSEPAVA